MEANIRGGINLKMNAKQIEGRFGENEATKYLQSHRIQNNL